MRCKLCDVCISLLWLISSQMEKQIVTIVQPSLQYDYDMIGVFSLSLKVCRILHNIVNKCPEYAQCSHVLLKKSKFLNHF